MPEDIDSVVTSEFDDATERVIKLPDQTPQVLLKLYGLYKQATRGDVSGKRPGRLDFRGRAKYDAWTSRKGLSKEEAMKAYAELVKKLEDSVNE
ncbi:MAG: acyl-CoA-binding protein [Candidatus Hodarchaeales archaeon]|jgi:acyl-CoA-binding protein